jgi:hypothetical protein
MVHGAWGMGQPERRTPAVLTPFRRPQGPTRQYMRVSGRLCGQKKVSAGEERA